MVSQKYRWDFIGLSTDTKPTSETSDKVVNGSTYYCSDTSKLYVYCDGTWYERKPLGGGGGGGTSNFNDLSNRPKYNGSEMTGSTNIPEVKNYTAGTNVSISEQNVISATDTTYSDFTGTDGTAAGTAGLVPAPATTDAGKFLKADGTWDTAGGSGPTVVQTTGTSTTDVMSQNATTSMVFADPSTKQKVQIGNSANAGGDNSVAVGRSAQVNNANGSVALGYNANVGSSHYWSVALGANSSTTSNGEVSFGGPGVSGLGYNNSNYRLLTNIYNGQSAHDAATKGQLDSIAIQNAGAPTTATVGTVGQLLEDTTNGKLYICTDTTGGTYTWEEVGAGGGGSAITVLTTADYNYPSSSPDGVNPLALSSGIYKTTKNIEVYINRDAGRHPVRSTAYGEMYFVVDNDPQTASRAMVFYPGGADLTDSNGEEAIRMLIGSSAGTLMTVEHSVLTSQHVVNNLTSTDTLYPLSANQGKVINDKITPSSGASAPTASTVGELGKIYIDSSTDNAYMCTKVDGSTYTWKQITA